MSPFYICARAGISTPRPQFQLHRDVHILVGFFVKVVSLELIKAEILKVHKGAGTYLDVSK